MRFVIRDPKKGRAGSAHTAPPGRRPETQDMPIRQLPFNPYVVLRPVP